MLSRLRNLQIIFAMWWLKITTSERRTAFYLLLRGFCWRVEPKFVVGRKPDFITFGRGRMWVEVKALDPPASRTLLGFAHDDLKKRLEKLNDDYAVDAWVSSGFDQRASKRSIRSLRRQLTVGLDTVRDVYIGIPSANYEKEDVTIEFVSRSGRQICLICPRSTSGSYSCPPGIEPNDWTQDIDINDGGSIRTLPASKILSATDRDRLSLRVVPTPLHVGLASVGNSEVVNVNTVDKFRQRITDAAIQLKNGQRYLAVPGVVVIYNDSLGGRPQDLLIACLGDITVPVDGLTLEAGPGFYGNNGIFRAGRNTGISATTVRSRLFETVSVVNSHAAFEVNTSWLAGKVYAIDEFGNLVQIRGRRD